MDTIKIPAHYDGKQILLDEPIDLEPGTKLLVTIIPDDDVDSDEWAEFSTRGLDAAYSEHEPEYSLSLIKEHNPDYEGR